MWRYHRGISQRLRASLALSAGSHTAAAGQLDRPQGTRPQLAPEVGANPRPPRPEDSWIIFHQQQPAGIDIANLQLSLLQASLAGASIEARVMREQQPQPLDATDVASLPMYVWKRAARTHTARRRPPEASNSHTQQTNMDRAVEQQQRERQGGNFVGVEDAALQPPDKDEGSCGEGDADELPSCTVCLDAFAEGDHVLLLRCMHQFHVDCITPWLQRQGRQAQCPVCKTPAFLP